MLWLKCQLSYSHNVWKKNIYNKKSKTNLYKQALNSGFPHTLAVSACGQVYFRIFCIAVQSDCSEANCKTSTSLKHGSWRVMTVMGSSWCVTYSHHCYLIVVLIRFPKSSHFLFRIPALKLWSHLFRWRYESFSSAHKHIVSLFAVRRKCWSKLILCECWII